MRTMKKQRSILPLVCSGFILASGCTASAIETSEAGKTTEPLAFFEGQITDKTPGWTFVPSQADADGMSRTASEGYYPDRGGTLKSSVISLQKNGVEQGAWYKLTFDAKTAVHCYWGVNFYTADGKLFIADHNDAVFIGPRQHYVRYFYASDKAASIDIFFIAKTGIEAWNIVLEKATASEAAAGCDELYSKMPPLDSFLPQGTATQLLPKTAAALRNGTPFRVILLGDSVINDTYNSNFQSLIAKAFPNNKFEYAASVNGCAGGMFYQDPAKFKQFATDLKPDLLIIGGVSNCFNCTGADARNAMDKVLEMARSLNCEILMMTPGTAWDTRTYDLKNPGANLPPMSWDPKENLRMRMINSYSLPRDLIKVSVEAYLHLDFANDLRELAKKHGIPLLDVTPAAYRYVYASEKPWGWFARDAVHSNVYGKQINGRILANFLIK